MLRIVYITGDINGLTSDFSSILEFYSYIEMMALFLICHMYRTGQIKIKVLVCVAESYCIFAKAEVFTLRKVV